MQRTKTLASKIGRYIKEHWWGYIKEHRLLILYLLILSGVGIYLLIILQTDPNLSTATVAFGTLLLALVTAFSIDANRRIAKDRREEELTREKRERDERLLDEIRDWAIDVGKVGAEKYIRELSSKFPLDTPVAIDFFHDLSYDFNVLSVRGESIEQAALVFTKQRVHKSVVKLQERTETHSLFLREEFKESMTDDELRDAVSELNKRVSDLHDSASEVIRRASKIKLSLLNSKSCS